MGKWLTVHSAQAALTALVRGVDNYAHFDMFSTIRRQGALLTLVQQSPDGSKWAYYSYPQSFHGLAASFSELLLPRVRSTADLLPAYCQSVALVVTLSAIILTAAVVSVPTLQSRLSLLIPALTVAWVAILVEPGQKLLLDGFANFWLGTVSAGIALVLSLRVSRSPLPSTCAVASMLITCAHTWLPLCIFTAPGALVLLFSLRRTNHSPRRLLMLAAVVAGSAAAVGVAAVMLLRTVSVNFLVTTTSGGLHTSSPTPLLVLIVLGLASAAVFARPPSTGRMRRDTVVELRLFATVAPLGLLMLIAVGIYQMRTVGELNYYFLKYALGLEVLLAITVPVMIANVVGDVMKAAPRRAVRVIASLMTLLATQSFGTFPSTTLPLWSNDPFLGTAAFRGQLRPAAVAKGVLAAVSAVDADKSFNVDYLALGEARAAEPFYPDGWFHALQRSLSQDVFDRYTGWRAAPKGNQQGSTIIGEFLL
ncbi:MAG: hypothetical protein ACTHOK_20580, partial [Nocardioidaceae bacterium]